MKDMGSDIESIRREWGRRLLILGHHYQHSSVLCHADEIGDSLELARKAAMHSEAERIVFCGVRFMAESADILTRSNQTVYMPDTSAGCPMADMADAGSMQTALEMLETNGGDWLPVVYVNSSAEVKARCGMWGGSTCTSSNAGKVFQWVLSERKRIFFLPDEHLGVNTAHDLGMRVDEVIVYDPAQKGEGVGVSGQLSVVSGQSFHEKLRNVKVIVWKGFCLVHTAFTAEQVRNVRKRIPEAKIIVHPEVPKDVLRLADAYGSTSQIVKYVESAPEGSTVVIGTEINLVERLAREHSGRVTVKALSPSICETMARTNESNLLDLLHKWPERNEIHVPESVAQDARKALNTMLKLSTTTSVRGWHETPLKGGRK